MMALVLPICSFGFYSEFFFFDILNCCQKYLKKFSSMACNATSLPLHIQIFFTTINGKGILIGIIKDQCIGIYNIKKFINIKDMDTHGEIFIEFSFDIAIDDGYHWWNKIGANIEVHHLVNILLQKLWDCENNIDFGGSDWALFKFRTKKRSWFCIIQVKF